MLAGGAYSPRGAAIFSPMGEPAGRHRTPLPKGPLSGRRRSWRRAVGKALAAWHRAFQTIPPGPWLRRRLRNALDITTTDLTVAVGECELLHIVFLSDLHAGLFMNAGDLRRVAEIVNALHPDLVCFGGDVVNTRWEEVKLLGPALDLLHAPLGLYAVPGNHEYYRRRDYDRWSDYLADRGVEVLRNRGVRVDTGTGTLWLAGIDDLTEGQPDLDAALAGRRSGETTILLSHHPDTFIEACDLDVDLQLSGHTHGGQILLFGYAPLVHSRHGFRAGLYHRNGRHLFVSCGVGVTALPLRIGTRPEISLLRLRS